MANPRLQAQRSANFDEFTDLLFRLINAAWGSDWGTFMQAFPNGRDPTNVSMPIITYHMKRKTPGIVGRDTQEIKPRFREAIATPTDPEEVPVKLSVYSQVFDYEVVFDIWHQNNVEVDALAERFEDFMMTFTGYIMSQGVQRLIFKEETDETGTTSVRDDAVVRSFKYLVRLEKHVEVPEHVIQEVIGQVGVYDPDKTESSIDESIKFSNN